MVGFWEAVTDCCLHTLTVSVVGGDSGVKAAGLEGLVVKAWEAATDCCLHTR